MSEPSPADQERAKWALLQAQIRNQIFWEPWKAITMMIIAAAAIFAAGGLSSHIWPGKPQEIIVRIEQPIAVKLQP